MVINFLGCKRHKSFEWFLLVFVDWYHTWGNYVSIERCEVYHIFHAISSLWHFFYLWCKNKLLYQWYVNKTKG
jgi:hypothetical protein